MRLKLFEPDAETRAFIYQQIQELSRTLPEPLPVVVLTRRFESEKRPQYLVEMALEVLGQSVRLGARSPSVYEAITLARNKMGLVLQALQNAMDSGPERERAIHTLMIQPSWAVH